MAKQPNENNKKLFDDLGLAEFKKNNPQCELSKQKDQLILEQPWGTQDAQFVFDLNDLDIINDLNNIAFRKQFDAIIHLDKKSIEFIFGYLNPKEERTKAYLDREFQFHFEGSTFNCAFKKPTNRLLSLSRRFRRSPSESGAVVAPQLLSFRDAQRLDKLPDIATQYFKGKVPRNFFIHSSSNPLSYDIESICRHLNLLTWYYDRLSPQIVVRRDNDDIACERRPLMRYVGDAFPEALSIAPVDDFLLQLIEVARESIPRFAFIYYYQVFEYAGFYYVDDKARRELRRLLKDPAIINCPEDRLSEFFSIFSDIAHTDEVRMRKVIEECCDPRVVWDDIEHDKSFFTTETSFEGGFKLDALIAEDTTIDTWCTMWMPKLFDQLTKIRNCVVHARERRQSRVILPTSFNNSLIERYIPIIARMAEQISFHST